MNPEEWKRHKSATGIVSPPNAPWSLPSDGDMEEMSYEELSALMSDVEDRRARASQALHLYQTNGGRQNTRRWLELTNAKSSLKKSVRRVEDFRTLAWRRTQQGDAVAASAALAQMLKDKTAELDSLKDADLAIAFMEEAKDVLAEVTYGKLLARARSRRRGTKASP
jgi:hypothetical protein